MGFLAQKVSQVFFLIAHAARSASQIFSFNIVCDAFHRSTSTLKVMCTIISSYVHSFSFGGDDGFRLNLDDLFTDNEDASNDIFSQFFGGGDSFFGDLDHVKEVYSARSERTEGRRCTKTTRRQGGMISEHTVCS